MHLPARLWPVGTGACEVYGSDRLHPSTVQGCVMVVRHMPDDNSEARALSARAASAAELLAANRAAERGASEASVLHCAPALRGLPPRLPGPCWPSAQPRTCRQEVLCALSRQYSAFPPACMHSGAGREMMRVGAAAARMAGAAPAAATRLQVEIKSPKMGHIGGQVAP